ncbi:polymer-forming cytoskeletal protein [Paenibacillus sp. JX-17]|uniref:Polymer-forming cytoskeletal protein n=1 Tax=Paenibacillus lacisoli TaxID=3064525 RepID=A0ABT9CBG1_9BACL|nr:polymer-forming cytoskeletal protein [Paenibacillus sp. JX-17]MDO7906604.1 polymer-forming cytoskeletal protein [Paenibacillus sp. JX-17]
MSEQQRNNLSIAGIGTAVGGIYGNVRVDGACRMNGALECTIFTVNGNCKVSGALAAQEASVNGMVSVQGSVQAERLWIGGNANFKGTLDCQELQVNGRLVVDGSVHAEQIKVNGRLKAGSDIQCEHFAAEGGFDITGLLNAGRIEIIVNHRSEVSEIGGEQISVMRKGGVSLLKQLFGGKDAGLTASLIEGDDVHLEHTEARTVRGSRVRIGPGCRIGVVEYKEELTLDPQASVGRTVQH